ncbi:MAG TPA: DUF1990 domain-containing protein [Acidimicrobiales bacterium]|nr:DUF1990 domain-containing protein [Acidimicrobiales bacterium]
MRLVVPASRRSIERTVARAATAPPTVATQPGAVLDPRYVHDRLEGVVGHGERDFTTAASGLRTWATHRVRGVRVFPTGAPVASGATRVVTFGTPLVAIAAPCRVTEVVDEPRRAGFTYVTLRGHPEEGEESFVVELDANDDVRCTITARSRPGSRLVRATAPVNRYVQHRVARGYLRALERHVAAQPVGRP